MTDYSQPFLPPINHLVGGTGAWDQNLTGTAPFSSQLSGDLYSNLGKPPDIAPYSVSALGNRDRENYAANQARQNNMFDEYSSNMWNARQNVFGPMSNGFNNPSFPNVPAPDATSMSIIPYGGGFGGQSFINPSMFNGAGAGGTMIGGGTDDIKYITSAKDAVKEMAIVMKDQFTPALQGSTQQIQGMVKMLNGGGTTGPDIIIGGNGSMGGYAGYLGSGGAGGGFGGGSGGGGFNNGNLTGYEAGFPNMNDGAYSGGGGFGLSAPGIFKIRQGYNMFIRPAMNDMNAYMSQSADQSQMLQQSGMISYGDMMGGTYGTMARQQAAGNEFQLAMGRNIYNSYGSIANSVMGGDAGRGIGGALLGIGQVSAGAALVGAGIGQMFGPLGAGAGALLGGGAAAIVGAAGYASSAANDPYAIGSFMNSKDGVNDFQGAIGGDVLALRNLVRPMSNQDKLRVYQMQNYASNVDQFASGNISTQDLKAWSAANGFSGADAVGAGLEKFYQNGADLGWDRGTDQKPGLIQAVTAFDLSLNPNKLPGQLPQLLTGNAVIDSRNRMNGAGLFNEQMSLGSGFNNWMQQSLPSIAQAMGVSPGDQAGLSGLNNMYTAKAYDIQQAGGNVALWQAQQSANTAPIGAINQNRYRAGYGSILGTDYYDRLSANPYIQSDNEGIDDARYGYQASDPGFATNVSNPLLNRASYYSRSGKPDVSGRIQSMMPQLNRMYDQAASYGQDATSALLGYSEIAATNPQQGSVVAAIGSGDRLALAQNWRTLGDIRYQTINPDTGAPAMRNSMSQEWYGALQQDQGSLVRLPYADMAGGQYGLQDRLRDISRGMNDYQYQQATATRNIGYQSQTGGATRIDGQGFAVGGDGLSGLSNLFASQGMAFNRGNGMGYWQIDDANTQLNRSQQQYNYNYQGQVMAINQSQFNLSNAYQSQNMTIARGQQTQQEQWQSQDLSMSRNKMELSYGWQQEDFDRNIRFSRGRDRIDLERQESRAAIMHSLDETQQGNAESRQKTETQWNKEEFDRKKAYFDQSKSLQQQQMDLEKERFAKQGEEMKQQWGLEDQRRILDRQNEQLQYKMQTDMAVAVKATTDLSNKYNDALTAIGREYDDVNPKIDLAAQKLTLLGAAASAFNGGSPSSLLSPSPSGSPSLPSIPHVPGGGASVGLGGGTHGNDAVVQLLTQAVVHLKKMATDGLLNATIYPGSSPVQSGDLYKVAGTMYKRTK